MKTRLLVIIGALVALTLVAGLLLVGGPGDPGRRTLTATFPSTVNLYDGAEVKVLGVVVGQVESVEVVDTAVEVEISYEPDVDLPLDVHAVIVPPSIVGDRFVQLTPAYTGSGPVLADDAALGLDRTGVPVELDDTYRQLTELSDALGPRGANRDGSLSRLVRATAGALKGNGARFNRHISQLAAALDTLAASDESYQSTVDQAGALTRTLMTNDGTVRRLVLALARVSGQLNAQRDDISRASTDLSEALGDVARFTRTHRAALTDGIAGTRDVAITLNRRTKELQDLLALAPVGFVSAMNINLPTNWSFDDPGASSPEGRTTSYLQRGIFTSNLGVQLSATLVRVCATVSGAQAAQLSLFCAALAATGNDLGLLLSELTALAPPSPGAGPTMSRASLFARLRDAARGEPR